MGLFMKFDKNGSKIYQNKQKSKIAKTFLMSWNKAPSQRVSIIKLQELRWYNIGIRIDEQTNRTE